jgi:hypothetical protein
MNYTRYSVEPFKEYPKCLYLGGLSDAAFCVVLDATEEQQARTEGYLNIGESQEKAKRKTKAKE